MTSKRAIIEEVISSESTKENPIALNFQNQRPDITKCSYVSVEDSKTRKKIAILSTDKHLFQGEIGEGFTNDLVDTFMIVRNKRTNKVRFIEIDQVSMKNTIYEDNKQNPNDSLLIDADDDLKKKLLLKNFGGRRAIRGLDRRERMKMNIDVVKDQLEKSLNESTLGNDNINETSQLDSTYLDDIRPPYNESAEKLQDVYSLDDLIPRELLNRLEDETTAILETNIENLPIASEMIRQKIVDIKKSKDYSEPKKDIIKALIYMDGLANLVKTRSKTLKNVQLSEITAKVENDICQRFKEADLIEQKITPSTKHKAFTYFLALAFVTTGKFELDLDLLTQSLSLPEQKIRSLAKLCHTKVNYKTKKLCLFLPGKVQLPGPKKFPKMK